MNVSAKGSALIKKFEGLRLETYDDQAPWRSLKIGETPFGTLTIGYGHTGASAYIGKVITQAEADELLRKDLEVFENGVNALLGRPIHQSGFDAFVSLAFNIGLSAFGKSTALKRAIQGNMIGAAEAITWFNKVRKNGKLVVEPGLVRRRAEEKALFLSEVSSSVGYQEISSMRIASNLVDVGSQLPSKPQIYEDVQEKSLVQSKTVWTSVFGGLVVAVLSAYGFGIEGHELKDLIPRALSGDTEALLILFGPAWAAVLTYLRTITNKPINS